MPDAPLLLLLAIAAGAFALGVGAGAWLRRDARKLQVRIEELERQLTDAHGQLDAQQEAVRKHFEGPSERFRDLTEQYSALYTHLSEGARELCPERTPAIGQGSGALLGLREGEPEAEPVSPPEPREP